MRCDKIRNKQSFESGVVGWSNKPGKAGGDDSHMGHGDIRCRVDIPDHTWAEVLQNHIERGACVSEKDIKTGFLVSDEEVQMENSIAIYPNPTSDLTTIKYSLQKSAQVTFELIDITGKTIISSLEGNKTEGSHLIELNTNELKAGVYFYSINVNGNKLTKKMTISK